MPVVSRFYGISIRIHGRDHGPPHFHVQYGEERAAVEIATGNVLAGRMSPRTARLVGEWLALHRLELQENWECAQAGRPCFEIEPL
ncbi:MAG: DUF4160 domain-containing protein [Verrucomicrobiae bacterium]|nr:DUF4160 domain-containing protein [Verrucomicrobiae bacterium]